MSQPSPKPGKKPVGEAVLEDIKQRIELGRKRYGTVLQTHNGRDALQDLYEELIDATMYAKQRMMEEPGFVEFFNAVAGIVHDNAVDKGFWDNERNDGEALMLIVSELSEALEALRAGNPPDDKIPEYSGVEAELADTIIRIMDLATGRGWRVAEALIAKIQYNRSRPHKHGKAF